VSGVLLLLAGALAAAHALDPEGFPPLPFGFVPLGVALLLAGAGAAILFALWDARSARRAIVEVRHQAQRANAERDLALLQARRSRAQAEGLALMREIHRSTGIPERHERLHRILTLVGDLFEAREVVLFAASPGSPVPVTPAAYLRVSVEEELFVTFDAQNYERGLEKEGSGLMKAPKIKDAALAWEGCRVFVEGSLMAGEAILAKAQWRRTVADYEGGLARQNPTEILERLLGQLDTSPTACRHVAKALEQRRTLRQRESGSVFSGSRNQLNGSQTGGDDSLMLCVPLLADQRGLGVLRIRRPAEGFDGPVAETLEELLLESAKHIALAVKKDEDDLKAITDQLTGLFIKRHFLATLERLRSEVAAGARPFALVLCDIDHFKKVNDTHGHLSGDMVLKETAKVLRGGLRAGDMAFRYGGEELAIVMPGTPTEAAEQSAERLRASIQKHPFLGEKGQAIPVTISMGTVLYKHGLTAEQLISRADRALYCSKKSGRNRVTPWRADLPDPLAEKQPAPAK